MPRSSKPSDLPRSLSEEAGVTERTSLSGPLVGTRIVEFAGIGPVPYACMLLADMGAEIIRVDRAAGTDPYAKTVVVRGRRTVTADLKDPVDLARIMDLLAEADALVEGFRPGVMERLGLGPDVVLERSSHLVYGRMTGWGQTGPLAQAAGHDLNYIAITGALAAIGPATQPLPPLNLVGDYGGGSLFLVTGLLAALLEASRTGQGQVIDAAICDGAASLMAIFSDLQSQDRLHEGRMSNMLDGGAPYYRTYECGDGEFVAIAALEPQFYTVLCRALELGEIPDRDSEASWPDLHRKFEAIFRQRSRAEWGALLEGTDACFAPVLSLGEAPLHPHMAARNAFFRRDGVVQPAPAPRFSRTPSSVGPVFTERVPVAEAAWAKPPSTSI